MAGEIWYAGSVLFGVMLFGLAVFFFLFGILPYWFKLHKHLNEILGCWALTFPNGTLFLSPPDDLALRCIPYSRLDCSDPSLG
jgi:hypothetical protein